MNVDNLETLVAMLIREARQEEVLCVIKQGGKTSIRDHQWYIIWVISF